jgi:hypothetical protein
MAPLALDFECKILGVLDAEDQAALERGLRRITERARELT